MTRRREQPWLLLAFAIASATHVALVGWLVAVDRRAANAPPVAARAADVRVDATPAVVRLPLPPREERDTPIGEETGRGDSAASIDLPEPTVAPRTFDFEQAWTRQAPVVAPPPSPPAPQAVAAAPLPRESALGPIAPRIETPPPPAPTAGAREIELAPEAPSEEVARDAPSPSPARSTAPQLAKAEPSKEPPPSPTVESNAGLAGPSDLDAFAKAEGVEFKPGGIEARTGRKVKLTRPRVDLGFMTDATAFAGRSVTIGLKIQTDAAGFPTRVDVVKSSGSKQIDDAIRLAMYDSWFGGRMPDAFPFAITLWK